MSASNKMLDYLIESTDRMRTADLSHTANFLMAKRIKDTVLCMTPEESWGAWQRRVLLIDIRLPHDVFSTSPKKCEILADKFAQVLVGLHKELVMEFGEDNIPDSVWSNMSLYIDY